ncbi:MAG: glutamine synthetase type III, partial [Candidatus Kuenenia stuttgartiensis]|nr:glutamine synthetase type III [Candidatus Kuenenia stuttgartiensis]
KKAVDLFRKYKVLSKEELHSRREIYLEQYAKQICIEAKAALDMARSLYIPAVLTFVKELAESIEKLETIKGSSVVQRDLLTKVSTLLETSYKNVEQLDTELTKTYEIEDSDKRAAACRDTVVATMNDLRQNIDSLEKIVSRKLWPVPTYADLLFNL